ncbi:hydroxyacylglutathione hydrolase [Pleionea sp. CnH1-48]|uniref:hydroxyacylglutathione hydrolase n=1 Tax=Pleionea sp. CnH1-48 TaxID=2954494 RepID=UPI0020972D5C|nr:hydroxyacylglutathione hydrolase [Pleionea sp. CnH1-48]MCO7225424.1 hydroxyacylglutathione hydrolase [Pleionea sp. CnH1-48]
MSTFTVEPIKAFNDNYIWALRNDREKKVTLVDPGDANPVIDYLQQHQLTLDSILITHYHRDHVGGIKRLKAMSSCHVYGPSAETIPDLDTPLCEQDNVVIEHLQTTFRVLDVPGHTLGHIAYYAEPALFCGDTLFAGGCGRMFEGTPPQFLSSLTKLANLPAATKVYCAHEYTQSNLKFAQAVEPDNAELKARISQVEQLRLKGQPTVPSLLGEECQTNPFLRCQQPSVVAAAETFCAEPLSTPSAVFATIRRWKDTF